MDGATPGVDPLKFNDLFCWESIWVKVCVRSLSFAMPLLTVRSAIGVFLLNDQVEDELFCVPRSGFTPEFFADVFQLPSGTANTEVGAGRDKTYPIVLSDLRKTDFESLLNPTNMVIAKEGIKLDLGMEELMNVLKLTTKWKMVKLRDIAIDCLSRLDNTMSPVEKIRLAREYHIEGWVKEGIKALVQEPSPSVDELGLLLGWDSVAHIFAIREHDLRRPKKHCESQICLCSGNETGTTDRTFIIVTGGNPGTEQVVAINSIHCTKPGCWGQSQIAHHGGHVGACTSCHATVMGHVRVFIEPTVDQLVDKYFGDEIKQCDIIQADMDNVYTGDGRGYSTSSKDSDTGNRTPSYRVLMKGGNLRVESADVRNVLRRRLWIDERLNGKGTWRPS
ncbi:hypothetical protein FA15DRAFT_724292 [Coprinopsis marcescibilis]|uniref:BTB domain-containing protein n=1 Tax=Coprinopsis marcescibilis TaxID=230819 RepID=A0A5C3KHK3_COPMA|nr:hypothetical protein FA15DRAFT_724292 [Coprinopsis marcescibilis]